MFENVFKVFTKEHQENAEHLDVKFSMRSKIKLKNASELIDEKIEHLINCGYESNCSIRKYDVM